MDKNKLTAHILILILIGVIGFTAYKSYENSIEEKESYEKTGELIDQD